MIGDVQKDHVWSSNNVLRPVGYMNVIIRMLVTYGLKSFLTQVQERIFFVRFLISMPRQNEQIFTSKSKIFKFSTPNLLKVSMSVLPKPLHNISHALEDSNIQGYHFRRHTFREPFENVIAFRHSEKNTKIVKKKLPFIFKTKNQNSNSDKSFLDVFATTSPSQNFDFQS